MKKKSIAMCLLLMVFVLCACGNKTYAETKENRADQENAEENEDGGLVFDKPERFVIPKTRDKYGNQVLLGTINPEGADWGEGKEPLFIGAIDDDGVLFRIPFRGEIVEINEYGILHKSGETERFTPFSPVVINGELFFAEYSPEFFEAIKGYYLKDENAPEGEAKTETETETETI